MEKSYEEILRLLKMLKKPADGFVFRGSTEYLKDVSKPVNSEAVQDLIQKAKKSSPEDPLYVVAIGCITNVASAILIEPEIIKNIVVAWLIHPSWVHTELVHSPILTDQATYSVDRSRHFIRMAGFLDRDAIFRDLFSKLSKNH
jgi:hypothetical protein